MLELYKAEYEYHGHWLVYPRSLQPIPILCVKTRSVLQSPNRVIWTVTEAFQRNLSGKLKSPWIPMAPCLLLRQWNTHTHTPLIPKSLSRTLGYIALDHYYKVEF